MNNQDETNSPIALSKEVAYTLKRGVAEKVVRWIIFSVLLGLVPLIARGFTIYPESSISIWLLLSPHGEILLISSILCAAASGELLVTTRSFPITKIFFGGSALALLLFATLYFGHNFTIEQSALKSGPEDIALISWCVYATAVFLSTLCIALSSL